MKMAELRGNEVRPMLPDSSKYPANKSNQEGYKKALQVQEKGLGFSMVEIYLLVHQLGLESVEHSNGWKTI